MTLSGAAAGVHAQRRLPPAARCRRRLSAVDRAQLLSAWVPEPDVALSTGSAAGKIA